MFSCTLCLSFKNSYTIEHLRTTASVSHRSSCLEVFYKKDVLENFAKFTGKHLCQILFFNEVAGPATLLKKRLWHRCFPVNFAKFLRTPILQVICGKLLLHHIHYTVEIIIVFIARG